MPRTFDDAGAVEERRTVLYPCSKFPSSYGLTYVEDPSPCCGAADCTGDEWSGYATDRKGNTNRSSDQTILLRWYGIESNDHGHGV